MNLNQKSPLFFLPEWKLAVLWTLALLGGAFTSGRCVSAWSPLLEEASHCEPGLIGAMTVSLLPVLASVLLVWIFGKGWIWILCSARAFLLGLTAGVAGAHWGPAAPLMAVLLLGSMMLSSAVLLLLWQRLLSGGPDRIWEDGAVAMCCTFLIACSEIWVTAPFLTEIMNLQRG